MKLFLGILAISIVAIVSGCASQGSNGSGGTGDLAMSQFAKCLTEKGAVFYGTEWCPHCNNQKAMFGDAMKNINFIDCDKESQACTTAGIEGYPTRVFKDGSKTPGTQEFAALAAKTGCEVPQS